MQPLGYILIFYSCYLRVASCQRTVVPLARIIQTRNSCNNDRSMQSRADSRKCSEYDAVSQNLYRVQMAEGKIFNESYPAYLRPTT